LDHSLANDSTQSKDLLQVEVGTDSSGNSPRAAVTEMPLCVLGATHGHGVLRLRKNFAFAKFLLRSG